MNQLSILNVLKPTSVGFNVLNCIPADVFGVGRIV